MFRFLTGITLSSGVDVVFRITVVGEKRVAVVLWARRNRHTSNW